jgi:hypothetical protein
MTSFAVFYLPLSCGAIHLDVRSSAAHPFRRYKFPSLQDLREDLLQTVMCLSDIDDALARFSGGRRWDLPDDPYLRKVISELTYNRSFEDTRRISYDCDVD